MIFSRDANIGKTISFNKETSETQYWKLSQFTCILFHFKFHLFLIIYAAKIYSKDSLGHNQFSNKNGFVPYKQGNMANQLANCVSYEYFRNAWCQVSKSINELKERGLILHDLYRIRKVRKPRISYFFSKWSTSSDHVRSFLSKPFDLFICQ